MSERKVLTKEEIIKILKERGIKDDEAEEVYTIIAGSFFGNLMNKLIDNLPFELHYVSPFRAVGKLFGQHKGNIKHSYSGPGTRLDKRIDPKTGKPHNWAKPVNMADEAAMEHDLCYERSKNSRIRRRCDKKMIRRLDKAKGDDAWYDRADAYVLSGIMKTKRAFGLGLNEDRE